MMQEQSNKITSALKKAYDALTIALGLCIIAMAVLVVVTIALFVGLEFYYNNSKAAKKQNDCVHLQGVPGCYRNPNGYYGGPHNPNPHSHFSPQTMSAYEHRTR